MAHLLKFAYQLRQHHFGAWALDRWAVVAAWGAAALLWLQWSLRGRPALPLWHWAVLAALVLAGAGFIALRVWAARRSYIVFLPEAGAAAPAPRPLTPDEKVATWATGRFEVEGRLGFFAGLQAYWRTFITREHAVLAIRHPSQFLLLGDTPDGVSGMWYIFIAPHAASRIVPGKVAFGARSGPGLRVDYRVAAEGSDAKKSSRKTQETVYLLFDDAQARDRAWADLLC